MQATEQNNASGAQSFLTDELAAMKRDAERYRWIREQHKRAGRSLHVRHACNDVLQYDLDAEIDALMAANVKVRGAPLERKL